MGHSARHVSQVDTLAGATVGWALGGRHARRGVLVSSFSPHHDFSAVWWAEG